MPEQIEQNVITAIPSQKELPKPEVELNRDSSCKYVPTVIESGVRPSQSEGTTAGSDLEPLSAQADPRKKPQPSVPVKRSNISNLPNRLLPGRSADDDERHLLDD